MKRLNIFLILSCLLFAIGLQAQVSKLPQNKNFLIEKGTGQVCSGCPLIDSFCEAAILSHPGRGMMIMYHVGPYARPQIGLADYTNPQGDSLYNTLPFTYNMMVNRHDQGLPWGYTYIYNQVQGGTDDRVAEASPLNLAMNMQYDKATRKLTVEAEGYYTANSGTAINYINIALLEDSLISKQTDGRVPGLWVDKYNHMNVFRGYLTGMWGDTVSSTNQGGGFKRTYTYTLPSKLKEKNCKLILFVTDEKHSSPPQAKAGEIITCVEESFEKIVTGVNHAAKTDGLKIYPNPSTGAILVSTNMSGLISIEVVDMAGKSIWTQTSTIQETSLDLSAVASGLYVIQVKAGQQTTTQKLLLNR